MLPKDLYKFFWDLGIIPKNKLPKLLNPAGLFQKKRQIFGEISSA
jgi:hypothetical protein